MESKFKIDTSECATCGHTWLTGMDGTHHCPDYMIKRPGGFRYMVEYNSAQSRTTSVYFDEEPVSDVQILNQLHSQQAEISRLKAAFSDLGTYINGVAINYE